MQVPSNVFPLTWRSAMLEALAPPVDDGRGDRVAQVDPELRAAVLAAAPWEAHESLLVLTDSVVRAEALAAELQACQTWLGTARPVYLLPEVEGHHRQLAPAHESERSRVLDLTREPGAVFVASILAALAPTPAPERFRMSYLTLEVGDRSWPPELLARFLVDQDYDNEAQVHVPGEFSWRGGIVDVFSPAHDFPLRLDFFGDELESIRQFDPETQRSLGELRVCRIIPRGEAMLRQTATARDVARDREVFGPDFDSGGGKNANDLHDTDYAAISKPFGGTSPQTRALRELAKAEVTAANQAGGMAMAAARSGKTAEPPPSPAADGPGWCFLDWFDVPTLRLAVDSRAAIEAHLEKFGDAGHAPFWKRLAGLDCPRLLFESDGDAAAYPPERVWTPPVYALTATFRNSMAELDDGFEVLQKQLLRQQLGRWGAEGYRFVVACESQGRLDKAMTLLIDDMGLPSPQLAPLVLPLSQGFYAPEPRLALLTEAEIFGRSPVQPVRRQTHAYHADRMLHAGGELNEGDLAVHVAYGICRFKGLRFEPFQSQIQEVLVLEFDDDVKVFVPVDQAHLISRYVGAGKKYPKLSKVGARAWKTAIAAAGDAVKDLAAELLRIQALRETTPGMAYDPDDAALLAFEEAFPYTETPDQLRAIRDVQADLAAPRPMDRLVCGDVGFGKTEVAMRAAYQAVLSGKQVAVLVPTTVLCQQHYLTFTERFKTTPVIIENLSRFRTGGEQRASLKALAEGKVDIVIGTHRLISSDVQFKELGLVIVDEEQRFGVQHKERLKALRVNVDILTMTATPIPRTLYQSMAGLRDMSTIVTAPRERLPVRTIVARHEDALVREAILRELERGGQVFYLHNRVQSIEKVTYGLKALVPDARFDIGHGQMHEHELEAAMLRFIEGQTDVLVCTTIIESGLDIPNANTIIIDRADMFGLAELYQLRGRVGRYHRQAYAYLLVPDAGLMQADARSRLAAIRKYTQLGAGFKLAMRDLEIRGAGNILGAEQSGHISAIGFDLYCQLLKEAVSRMQQNPRPARAEITLHLPFLVFGAATEEGLVAAYLPREYIADETLRLTLYRRLADTRHGSGIDSFAEELRDRFGPLPPAVEHLLLVAHIRLLATRLDLHAITLRDGKLLLEGPRGHLKPDGVHFPRVKTATGVPCLLEIREILRGIRPPGKDATGGGNVASLPPVAPAPRIVGSPPPPLTTPKGGSGPSGGKPRGGGSPSPTGPRLLPKPPPRSSPW